MIKICTYFRKDQHFSALKFFFFKKSSSLSLPNLHFGVLLQKMMIETSKLETKKHLDVVFLTYVCLCCHLQTNLASFSCSDRLTHPFGRLSGDLRHTEMEGLKHETQKIFKTIFSSRINRKRELKTCNSFIFHLRPAVERPA